MSASESPVSSPFARIALSLSGGGFRAAAYSLGTLKGLYLLGLLDNVHMLSTASGGTIAGAYYALRRKNGDEFPAIHDDFYRFLAQDQLLPMALASWEARLPTTGYKLIQAFADTYDALYDGATFGKFWEPDAGAAPFHLQSIIFGATELYSGLTFRFQHSAFLPNPKGRTEDAYVVGNGNVRLPSEYARQLRLGDVVAASAGFPGGFEPLIMPDDFLTKPGVLKGLGKNAPARVALLDGGIYDNQGIDSLLLANDRNRKYAPTAHQTHPPEQARLLEPTTLFLVADVSGADKNLYSVPEAAKVPAASPTLGQVFWGLVALLAGLLVGAGWLTLAPGTRFWGGLLAGLGVVLAGSVLALRWAWQQLGTVLSGVGEAVPGWMLPRLRRLSIAQLKELLELRAGSTWALLTSVFMRRVRSLTYEQLYRPVSKGQKPQYNVVSSIIGTIVTEHERQLAQAGKKPGKPSVRKQLAAVYKTICTAQEMPTTLWWQKHIGSLPAVVASAEITLCYQLLRRFEKQPPTLPQDAEVQRRAQLLWAVYQAKPGQLLPPTAREVLAQPTGTVAQLLAML